MSSRTPEGAAPIARRPLLACRRLLSPAHWQLLTVLGVASFFEGYDFNIITRP